MRPRGHNTAGPQVPGHAGSAGTPAPAPTSPACAHCALPVNVSARRAAAALAAEPLFCCIGCRLAHAACGEHGERGLIEARLLVAAFLSMGVMTLSLVLYSEDLLAAGGEQGLAQLGRLLRTALALLSLPVVLLLAPPLVSGALADLRRGAVRMDGLIALAVAAAWALSLVHTFGSPGPVYYETAAMVLVLVTFGRRLEAHARTRARDAGAVLAECLPPSAQRVAADGTVRAVPPGDLRSGETCRIPPGQSVPADVVVLEGRSDVITAHVTGEQMPRAVAAGDELPAGSLNGTGALVARVLRPARDGTLGRLAELLDAPLRDTLGARTADRFAGLLAALALVLALAAGVIASQRDGLGNGLQTALAVLLVACPCALGLATPLAYRAMRVALARRGVFVRDAGAIERAARADVAMLDKTGTLTEPAGSLQPLGDAASLSPPDHTPAAAHRSAPSATSPGSAAFTRLQALVAASGHALAATVTQRPAVVPEDVRVVPGCGVEGRFGESAVRAGRPDWLDECGATWPAHLTAARVDAARRGSTLVGYAEGTHVLALGEVAQRARPGALEALDGLHTRGLDALLVSGDHADAVAALAGPLGLQAHADQRPADKCARLEDLRARGHTAIMVGDGMNDAPVLRAAEVGVALASGTGLARSHADVELVGDDLRGLLVLVDGARTLRRTVRGNLAWTLAYNGIALTAAAMGALHPLLAVACMTVSSLVVSARSQRLLGWSPKAVAAPALAPAVTTVPASDRAPSPALAEASP